MWVYDLLRSRINCSKRTSSYLWYVVRWGGGGLALNNINSKSRVHVMSDQCENTTRVQQYRVERYFWWSDDGRLYSENIGVRETRTYTVDGGARPSRWAVKSITSLREQYYIRLVHLYMRVSCDGTHCPMILFYRIMIMRVVNLSRPVHECVVFMGVGEWYTDDERAGARIGRQ